MSPFTEFSSRKYFAHVEHDALYQYTSTKGIKKAPIMTIGAVLFSLR
ncbi:hypothetical protein UUU_38150 [Klebsiella pneumoniae subsp. pneumoniae DSM 30104 = JCM 1662 = NBRC 14940]|nr:hypothetical protein UUU_38150 [Klebsiella pneumoniae subsp. pneumoniae DSM 30104 = JCM 1662 = NBRC 14940]